MSTTLALAQETTPARSIGEEISQPEVEFSMPNPRPLSLMVPGVARDIEVKLASTAAEWEAAFRLVRKNYLESGYDPPSGKLLRFTPFHALPETRVFVAESAGRVVATFTVVPDNRPLGLPLESLYTDEVEELRRQGRRLAEVTSLAASGLSQREFVQVYTLMIRLAKQYHVRQGGDSWVFTVHPKHREFYRKVLGCVPLGPQRSYDLVQGNPAEPYWGNRDLMRSSVPRMYDRIFSEDLPVECFKASSMPIEVIRFLARQSSQVDVLDVEQLLGYISRHGRTRCW